MSPDGKAHLPVRSCCKVPVPQLSAACPECGRNGKPVGEITLKSLLANSHGAGAMRLGGFFFCATPACPVVYFNNERRASFTKEDINVRVGVKETDDPVPVCYCFGWTRDRILADLRQNGRSAAFQEISAKVKAGECACEAENPSGRCCLPDVNRVIKGAVRP